MTSVRQLLGDSVRLYRAHAALLAGFAAWALLPSIIGLASELIPNDTAGTLLALVAFLCEGAAIVWASVAIMRAARAIRSGAPLQETTFQHFSKLIGPLLIVAVLQTAAFMGGLILLVIPGILALIWFAFAQPAVVLDGAPPLEALSRSRALASGRFLAVAWRVIMGPLIIFALYTLALSALFALVSPLAGPGSLQLDGSTPFPIWADAIDSAATVLLVLPLSVIYTTLLYEDLKLPRA
jgi:hypothetical protein